MAKNLAELCSGVLWKTEAASDEIMYSAEEISKQSVEGAAWCPLIALSEMRKERDELKRELFSQKELELKDLEYSQPLHIAKKKRERERETYSAENTKCVAEQSFDKELMGVTQGLKQPSLQKPGVEVGPHQWRHYQLQ